MIWSIQQGLLSAGITVAIAKLCARFGVPRRTVCYTPGKAAAKVDPRFVDPIKALIEAEPSFGYRTVGWMLGFHKNTVQRIFRLRGWQVRKRAIGDWISVYNHRRPHQALGPCARLPRHSDERLNLTRFSWVITGTPR